MSFESRAHWFLQITQKGSITNKSRQPFPNRRWKICYPTFLECPKTWSDCCACTTVSWSRTANTECSSSRSDSTASTNTLPNYGSSPLRRYNSACSSIQFFSFYAIPFLILSAHSQCWATRRRYPVCTFFRTADATAVMNGILTKIRHKKNGSTTESIPYGQRYRKKPHDGLGTKIKKNAEEKRRGDSETLAQR